MNAIHRSKLLIIAAVAAASLVAIAWIAGNGGEPLPAPPPLPGATTPAPAATASPAAQTPGRAVPAQAVSVAPAAAPAAPTTTSAPASAAELLLPAQPAPVDIVKGRARVEVASAQLVYGGQGSAPTWVDLGGEVQQSRLLSFEVAAPAALRAVAPSSGLLRVRFRSLISASTSGSYTLVASIAGGPLRALRIAVDGDAQAAISQEHVRSCVMMNACSTPTTLAGSVGLEAGWHEVDIAAIAKVGDEPASVTLYARAPGADAPVALLPAWPAPTAATPAQATSMGVAR